MIEILCFTCKKFCHAITNEYKVPNGVIEHLAGIYCNHYNVMEMIPRLQCPYYEVLKRLDLKDVILSEVKEK